MSSSNLWLVLWLLCCAVPSLALQSFKIQRSPRRAWLKDVVMVGLGTVVLLPTQIASAQQVVDETNIMMDAKAAAKEAVRVESDKGIAYMKGQLEAKDYPSLLEFTKTYDQILRKGTMGKAKQLMKESSSSEVLTSITNAVTFDLIGINRSVRKGQENPEQAARYIQMLQEDVNRFLSMD